MFLRPKSRSRLAPHPFPAKRPDRGDARRAKTAGPIVGPTGRSAIISPETTSAGRTPPRVEIFSIDPSHLATITDRLLRPPRRPADPNEWPRGEVEGPTEGT